MTAYDVLFGIGETFESFVMRGLPAEIAAVRAMQGRLAEPGAVSPHTLQRLHALRGHYHLLIAGEMWCPDCQLNLTAIDYLQRATANVDLAIVTKGRAENALKQRLELERIPVPLVLVLGEKFQLIGRFIEMPQDVIAGAEAVKPDYRAGNYLESTIREILDILETAEHAAER